MEHGAFTPCLIYPLGRKGVDNGNMVLLSLVHFSTRVSPPGRQRGGFYPKFIYPPGREGVAFIPRLPHQAYKEWLLSLVYLTRHTRSGFYP